MDKKNTWRDFLIYHFKINQAMNKIQFSIKCCNFFFSSFTNIHLYIFGESSQWRRRQKDDGNDEEEEEEVNRQKLKLKFAWMIRLMNVIKVIFGYVEGSECKNKWLSNISHCIRRCMRKFKLKLMFDLGFVQLFRQIFGKELSFAVEFVINAWVFCQKTDS